MSRFQESEPTASQRLRWKIDLVYGGLEAAGRRIVEHPAARVIYPEFLIALHALTLASVPLMRAALERSSQLAPDCAVAAMLVEYFERHIPEEMGHDVWLLEDLEVLGFPREQVLSRLPSSSAAATIGSQYYWIRHCHPVALFGYMELAEGYPPTPTLVQNLMVRTGFPESAFRALLRHAVIDLEHRDGLHNVIDRLPLSNLHQELMALSALHCIESIVQLFGEIAGDGFG